MKSLKFKDKEGHIHEFKDVLLFTGSYDLDGKEIWEGDTIVTPCYTARAKGSKEVMVTSKVVVTEQDRDTKTVVGDSINDPIEITTRKTCGTEFQTVSWSMFFRCKKVEA